MGDVSRFSDMDLMFALYPGDIADISCVMLPREGIGGRDYATFSLFYEDHRAETYTE